MVSPWQSGHPSVRASSLGWFQRFRPINFSTGFLSLSPWQRFSTRQISWLSIVHWSTSLTIIVRHQDTQWSCWFSDWNLCNLHNRVQVIQSYIDGHGDDDTNTDNDERALVLLDVICDDSRRQRATSSCLPSVQNPVTITMMVLIVIFRPISHSQICTCFCQAQRSR